MPDVTITPARRLRGGRRRRAGPDRGLAAEEGARAREAARARSAATGSTASRPWTSSGVTTAPAAAANNLHQAVHVARRALGTRRRSPCATRCCRSRPTSTSTRFEQAAAEARREGTAAAYRAALALYGGELLPENRYDDWAARRGGTSSPSCAAALEEELAELAPARRAGRAAGRRELVRRPRARARPSSARCSAARGCSRCPGRAAPARRGSHSSSRGRQSRVRRRRRARRARRAGRSRPVPDAVAAALDVRALAGQDARRCARRVPRAAHAAARARQLRAPARRERDARRRAPARRAAADGRSRRAASRSAYPARSCSGSRHSRSRIPSSALAPDGALRYEAVQAVRRPRGGAAPGFALDDGERRRRRAHLLPPRRPAARPRARRRPPRRAQPGGDRRATRRSLPPAALGQPRRRRRGSRRWWRRCSGATICSRRTSGCCSAGSRSSRAASTSTPSRAVCADDGVEAPGVADVLARLVEKSLVSRRTSGGRERRYGLLETVSIVRARTARRGGRDRRARRAARRAGRSRSPSASASRRGSTARPRTCARPSTRSLARDPQRGAPALRRALAVLAAPDRPRARHSGASRRRSPRRPSAASLARRGALAAAAFDFRAGTLASGARAPRRATTIASSSATRGPEWRALQLLGEFAHRDRCSGTRRRGLVGARRSSSPGAKGRGRARRSASTRWASRGGSVGDLEGCRGAPRREPRARSARSTPRRANHVTAQHQRHSRRRRRPAGLRVCFEETLQPFIEVTCVSRRGYVLANRRRASRATATSPGPRRCSSSAPSTSPPSTTNAVKRAPSSGGPTSSSPKARSTRRGPASSAPCEIRTSLNERRGVGLVLSGLGLVETLAGDFESRGARTSLRRVTCSDGPATGGGSRARCGGPRSCGVAGTAR